MQTQVPWLILHLCCITNKMKINTSMHLKPFVRWPLPTLQAAYTLSFLNRYMVFSSVQILDFCSASCLYIQPFPHLKCFLLPYLISHQWPYSMNSLKKESLRAFWDKFSPKSNMFKAVETNRETCRFQRVGSQALQGIPTLGRKYAVQKISQCMKLLTQTRILG